MYSKKLRQEIKQIIKDEKLYCPIEEFQNNIQSFSLQINNPLSEEFIEKFQDKLDWYYISKYQKLSESFIEKFKNKVVWFVISKNQNLSESFIEKFQDRIHWRNVSKYQKLSESFIEKFQDRIHWRNVSIYQTLSKSFIQKYQLSLSKTNWLYTPIVDKIKYIKENTDYEIKKDDSGYYLELYKSVRFNYYSVYNFHYKYEVGKTYESHCDYNLTISNSFGLSSWSKSDALDYHSYGRLLRVKVYVKDIGAITDDQKVRSTKLTIIEEIFDF